MRAVRRDRGRAQLRPAPLVGVDHVTRTSTRMNLPWLRTWTPSGPGHRSGVFRACDTSNRGRLWRSAACRRWQARTEGRAVGDRELCRRHPFVDHYPRSLTVC